MKRRKWKHACVSDTVDGFIKEKTGKSIEELTKWTGKAFKRFDEVKTVLLDAAKTKRPVYLVGDYDSDGINSTMIMTLLFVTMGLKYNLIIPKREAEGYGLSQKIIDRIPDGVILVTVDNGISAVEQMKNAKSRGMYTIILDHHTAGDEIPDVDILIDPSAVGEADYTHYCGAGISYRLAEYILGESHPLISVLSVFAAIGTIGDVVELTGDNRQIVIEGMKNMKAGIGTKAIQSLLEQAKFSESSSSTDIAFNIVPVLNAPERLEDGGAAKVCQVLLRSKNFDEGICWLMEQNQKRKDIVERIMKNVDLDEYRKNDEHIIFLKRDDIPLGVAGIIAGKLSEGTGKPSFVYGYDTEKNLKGSARCNLNGVNIINLIRENKNLLIGCGGHAGAAGLSLKSENYDQFKAAMESSLNKRLAVLASKGIVQEFETEEYTKWDVCANDLNFSATAKKILSLEPVGEGIPAPKIRIKTRLVKVQPFGGPKDAPEKDKPHIRFNLAGFSAIGFNMNEWYQEQLKLVKYPRFVDIVGTVMENIYQGNKSIQIKMDDFELS